MPIKRKADIFCKSRKSVDFSVIYARICLICKDYGETKQSHGTQREGDGESPLPEDCQPLPLSPGRTGTGAPVTEQLRCRASGELGWYRDSPRPYYGAGCLFFVVNFLMEVISDESETLWCK